MMRNKVLVLSCCLALLFCFGAVNLAGAAEAEPKVGQMVPNVKFEGTITPEGSKYLGLAKQGPFTLKDVKAPYVLVEQFNTSCPHCMAQAPVMDQLFELVQKDAALKGKLKFLGTGQGNQEVQVKMWKAFHKVPFALVPDPNSAFGKALNFTPYPVTVVLDKTGKILFVNIGTFDNADEVLQKIKAVVK
jgi:thiol-disulfide isomerase/thioredoxin